MNACLQCQSIFPGIDKYTAAGIDRFCRDSIPRCDCQKTFFGKRGLPNWTWSLEYGYICHASTPPFNYILSPVIFSFFQTTLSLKTKHWWFIFWIEIEISRRSLSLNFILERGSLSKNDFIKLILSAQKKTDHECKYCSSSSGSTVWIRRRYKMFAAIHLSDTSNHSKQSLPLI